MPNPPNNLDASASADDAFFTPAYLEMRRRAMEQSPGPAGMDELDPRAPVGHAYGIEKSTRITSYTKRNVREAAVDVTPQDVIDVLNAAGVKQWALMGLHGYVGYMPNPRGTQDVDILVAHRERRRAQKAIAARWPELIVHELSQVIRFLDPLDVEPGGQPKPVVDLMLPWSTFQELILEEYVVVDEATQHRIPTLEAALVSKYAAMLSLFRDREKKEYDAGDFRRLVRANYNRIAREDLRRLAGMIWQGGADEIERFVEIAISDKPFPI